MGSQMRRRIIFTAGMFALTVAAITLLVFNGRPEPCPVDVRYETFSKLRDGMSEKEVEAILGGPAGDYTTGPNIAFVGTRGGLGPRHWVTKKQWKTDKFIIAVYFDSQATVVWNSYIEPPAPPPSTRYPPPLQQILHPFLDP
jgi:hypothetical protein